MKIDKQYLINNMDKQSKTCKVCIETPWNYTSLSNLYSQLDQVLPESMVGSVGIDCIIPIKYNEETKTFIIELEINLQDTDLNEDSESED